MSSEDDRTPNQVAVRGWQLDTIEDLRDYLADLNGDGISEVIVLEREGALIPGEAGVWLAYCTDPDGEWFIECGDPTDRVPDRDEGWGYERVGLDFIANRGPFRVLDRRTLQLPPIEFDREDAASTLRAMYEAAARREAFILAGREYAPVGSSARMEFGS